MSLEIYCKRRVSDFFGKKPTSQYSIADLSYIYTQYCKFPNLYGKQKQFFKLLIALRSIHTDAKLERIGADLII